MYECQLFVPCREVLVLSDGGEVALDWAEPEGGGAGGWSPNFPIMLILAGLTGIARGRVHRRSK